MEAVRQVEFRRRVARRYDRRPCEVPRVIKILTAAEMNALDRATIAAGIPGIILMENAAYRVVEFLAERFSPLPAQRIVVVCGKGNNGGDGLAIARLLHVRFQPKSLDVVLIGDTRTPG